MVIHLKLNAPPIWVFLTSTLLVLAVLLTKYTQIEIPVLGLLVRHNEFQAILVAWGILFAGVAFKL